LDGYETGVEFDLVLPKELEGSFQRSNLEGGGLVCRNTNPPQVTPSTDVVELKCTSFDWIFSWAPASKLAHGGRAPLAYLKEHPDEDSSIHVVLD
jgi:hypothetical protein